ncbi:hypothetical protein [Anaerocolumna sp. MB42-C2]|uniref:hypothetical protein n=1 Tax=Anaerocolumna sp. MB42-C2 TaxID=3070997 RepID=UPI0027E16C0E|nr:hypothetical protein [Anaerocolumna sp. MB42-C2]WMJ87813.1 hypothetical protein RBU59_27920 [Anaerocolumna sp. MB42-C2]
MKTEEKQLSGAVTDHIISFHKDITLKELEHIAACDFCTKEYAKVIEEQAMLEAPHYLKNNILDKTRALSKAQEKDNSMLYRLSRKKLHLITFSMKIGLAMCGALALLLFTPQENVAHREPPHIESFMIKINDELNEFSINITNYTDRLVLSNKINSREEIRYDKKEK